MAIFNYQCSKKCSKPPTRQFCLGFFVGPISQETTSTAQPGDARHIHFLVQIDTHTHIRRQRQVLRLSDVEITTKDTVTINIYKQYILTKSPEVQSSACDVDRNGLPPNQRKIYTVNYNKSWLQSMETVSIVIWRKWSPRIQYIVDIWYM